MSLDCDTLTYDELECLLIHNFIALESLTFFELLDLRACELAKVTNFTDVAVIRDVNLGCVWAINLTLRLRYATKAKDVQGKLQIRDVTLFHLFEAFFQSWTSQTYQLNLSQSVDIRSLYLL